MQRTEKYQDDTNRTLKEHSTSIKGLEFQVSQIASSVNRLEAQGSGRLPSQSTINPREQLKAITLRSGKELEPTPLIPTTPTTTTQEGRDEQHNREEEQPLTRPSTKDKGKDRVQSNFNWHPIYNPIPFPGRLAGNKKKEDDKDIWEIFRKVVTNQNYPKVVTGA